MAGPGAADALGGVAAAMSEAASQAYDAVCELGAAALESTSGMGAEWGGGGVERVTFIALLVAAAAGYWVAWYVFSRKYSRLLRTTAQNLVHTYDERALRQVIGGLPSWLYSAESERAFWLNDLVAVFWPYVQGWLTDVVRNKVEASIADKLPRKVVSSFRIAEASLGSLPPRITGIKVLGKNARRDVESRRTFAEKRAELGEDDSVMLEVGFMWWGDPDITLALRSPLIYAGLSSVEAGLKNLHITAEMWITFGPLTSTSIPPFGAVQISFSEAPFVDFDLEVKAIPGMPRMDLMNIPGLMPALRLAFSEAMERKMTWPGGIISKLAPVDLFAQDEWTAKHADDLDELWQIVHNFVGAAGTSAGTTLLSEATRNSFVSFAYNSSQDRLASLGSGLGMRPQGVLRVWLIEGRGLKASDLGGTSDPYVEMFLRQAHKVTSRTCTRTLDAAWDEYFEFVVHNPEMQTLHLRLFDYDIGTVDDHIGSCSMPLHVLVPCQPSMRMLVPFGNGATGYVQLAVEYVPYRSANAKNTNGSFAEQQVSVAETMGSNVRVRQAIKVDDTRMERARLWCLRLRSYVFEQSTLHRRALAVKLPAGTLGVYIGTAKNIHVNPSMMRSMAAVLMSPMTGKEGSAPRAYVHVRLQDGLAKLHPAIEEQRPKQKMSPSRRAANLGVGVGGSLSPSPSRLARQATMESISPGSTSDAREGLRIKAEYGSKVPCPYKGASTLNADIEFDEGFDFQVRAPEEAFLTVEVWVQHPPTLRALLASRMFPVADLIAGRSDLGFVTFTADRANLSSEVPPSVYMSVAWQPETVPALEYGEPNPAPQGLENEGTLPRSDAQGLAQLVSAPQGIHSSSKRDAEGSVADVYGQLTPRRLSLDNFGA